MNESNNRRSYDLVVIGAGPAGYVGAIRAAQLKQKVALIEKAEVGGTCLNVGCIPSKTLIDRAHQIEKAKSLSSLGVQLDFSQFDYARLQTQSRQVVNELTQGIRYLLKKNGVELIQGSAQFMDAHTLEVGTQRITGSRILVATGSTPIELPGFAFDEKWILSSTGALMLQKLPKELLIIGGGVIGVEMAYIFSALGTKVSVIEFADRIIPQESPVASQILQASLERQGVRFYLQQSGQSWQPNEGGNGVVLTIAARDDRKKLQTLRADHILVVVGRRPNSGKLSIENAGIKLDERGCIPVNFENFQTEVPHIFAVGDVVAGYQLAHVGSYCAELAVDTMVLGKSEKRYRPGRVPRAIYTIPEVASFGPTQRELQQQGVDLRIGRFPYAASGKAKASDVATCGEVEVILAAATGEILSATIVGEAATEMIHPLLLAQTSELIAADISSMMFAHPSLSEMLHEAVLAAHNEAIHI